MKHEPLEIKNSILKELKLQLISDSKGRKFPHPGIEVQILAPEDAHRNKITAYFGEGKLQSEIHNVLQEPTCAKATPFVEISFIEETDDADFLKKEYLLRYISKAPQSDTEVYLEVLEGFANRKQMRLVHQETYIGRCQKVVNNSGAIERVNDLYFPDAREVKGKIPKTLKEAEKINTSVSRMHAHIKSVGGYYFLFDDDSTRGTSVLPEGRGSSEAVDNLSGKKISNNDIISFGKATVRVRVVKKS